MSVFSSCKNLPHESSQTDRNHRPINLRASMGVKGLHNSGNSCFMNSAIQCLANTFPLLEYILNDAYLKDVNYKYSGMHGLLMRTFVAVLKEMWSLQSRNRIIALSALKNEIGKIAPNFIGHSQQDAQEFLRLLLHGLRKEIIRPLNRLRPVIPINSDDEDQAEYAWFQYLMMNKSKVVDIFVGQLKSVLKCSTCGLRTVTFETFWDLSLPLPQKTRKVTLNQCLKLLTKKKKVKIICDRCMKQRKFCKTYSIVKLPKVLMIHLKRFHLYAPDRSSLHTSLNFPINGWNLKKFSNCHGPYIYNLYAVCYHQGEAHNGHYTACCKHPYTGERHKFDDAIVGKVSAEDLTKTFTVCSNGKTAGLTLDWNSGFSLHEGDCKIPVWQYKFSQLRGSSDDGKSKLKLHFQDLDSKVIETKELECSILQSLLFCMHAFLTAKVASIDPSFLCSVIP